MSNEILNIVVVGDGAVGKTCLLHAYTDESFQNFYQPTIYDKESFEITLDDQRYTIQLHDTAGQEDYDRIRQQFYKRAHCFLLCYSINNRISFENITAKWVPEITATQRVPIVLIATKLDLRRGTSNEVSTGEGQRMATKINANSFVECSAKDDINVKLAVEQAVRACFENVAESEPENDCCGLCGLFSSF
ncbi:ras-like GTP-binding protein RhoL [Toxorhynchites rutilus septentrionalis]|uniref:ras-like GTP-binding protein RhoL n=1 Tax=Toxorhynchites rutilus septentrionalis TaxID=329112 RepID=UPI0024783FB0|nr:ras-like GTP-binding protein RhoL [Toxorhynchites rutilus septentrionalis]XP_055645356.1 ras-like GTP-binding protein RhoL [Toxorhynchites rutilus septentrionalis]XP_055645357.1 ras-like GTP-binding protein RhoL [Toxorhynchites rutilus septentrionalis]